MKPLGLAMFALVAILLPRAAWGQTDALATLLAKKPAVLHPYFGKLYREGERNAVLNLTELATASIYAREYAVAESALDQAILRIDSMVVAGDVNAARAKSTFNEESVKDYKGEPYERAMTFYYRGLLFLRAGDFQNARAAFLNAGLQDTFSEQEKYAGDFGLMNYMASWASLCDGDDVRAKELLEGALKEDPSLSALGPPARLLVIVESGMGPVKVGEGKYRELLTFQDTPGGTDTLLKARIVDAAERTKTVSELNLKLGGDIYFQASTRGGRPVQGILNGKAEFKDTAGTVRDISSAVGNQAMMQGLANNNKGMANLGLAGMFVGLIADVAEKSAKPAADLRGWRTLPREIHLATANPEPLKGKLTALVSTSDKADIGTRVFATAKGCTLLWGRLRNPILSEAQLGKDNYSDRASADRNNRFRAQLAESF